MPERFKNHGVELRVSSFDPTLSLQCRPIQISQVLLNLLNNGFDAVDEAQEKWISVEVTEEETNLLIRIGDSGTGVPAEIRDKIFDPFFTTKSANGGTGLGLQSFRGIIESHGGTLQLETSNGGSWFLVTLPKVAACRD